MSCLVVVEAEPSLEVVEQPLHKANGSHVDSDEYFVLEVVEEPLVEVVEEPLVEEVESSHPLAW